MNHKLLPLSLCALFATTCMAHAQRPTAEKADARAEARANADARSSDSSRSSHSVTHKVVVVNGKTIVDERTENGRPTPAGGAGGAGPVGLPPLPELDAEEMLRTLREQVEREIGGGLPPRPAGATPHDARRANDAARDTAKRASSARTASGKDSVRKDTRPAPADQRPSGARGKLAPRQIPTRIASA